MAKSLILRSKPFLLRLVAGARLLGNVRVQARIAEIMRAGAECAEVTVEQVVRELKLIGFSDIKS